MSRQPSRFGAVDFADDLGREFNLPLERLSEKFSFEKATSAARENRILMQGRRVERMFEYVVAALGKANLITAEDSGAPLYSGDEVQAPDYFVSLKTGDRYLIEVKSRQPKGFHSPVTFSSAYLSRLKSYAMRKGYPLLIAIYWNPLRVWTINKIEDIESKKGTVNLRFADALQRSIASEFGDRMVAAVPPLVCRIHAAPHRPSFIQEDERAHFTISHLSFFSEGKEIIEERERQIAFYLMFHSRWTSDEPVAQLTDNRVEFVDISATPEEKEIPAQEFASLGSIAGMISSYYKWLTTANDQIIRLTPHASPGEMAPGFDDAYRGKVLRLWQFEVRPNYEPLAQTSEIS